MINIQRDEFQQLQEAIAAAHIFMQKLQPYIAQFHRTLDKQHRAFLRNCPDEIARAFRLIATITQREMGDPNDPTSTPTIRLTEIDTKLMRNELDNISALKMPDLVYEMECALRDLPAYAALADQERMTARAAPTLMAWSWESGRRHGLGQGIAILDCTIAEFGSGTIAALDHALNCTLELPTPDLPPKALNPPPDEPGPSGDHGPTRVN